MAKVIDCVHTSGKYLNSRRLVICCDGTWNNSNDSDDPDTNVSRLAGALEQKCCSGRPQIVYYHPGAGTEASWVAKKLGGLLGLGVAQDIAEVYRFVCDNYEPGDEIVLVGFSRGAFTARSVADMICNVGFLNRAGLDRLPDIFRDYETWQDWGKEAKFDGAKCLAGFTLENWERVTRTKIAWEEQETANLTQGDLAGTSRQVKAQREALKFEDAWQAALKDIPVADQKNFTAEKYAQSLADRNLADLNTRKKELWDKIRAEESRDKISEYYRKELEEHRMVLVEKVQEDRGKFKYRPITGHVRAVAVWDTVGSLGVPNTPWGAHARSDDEIRFTSLQMHKNVDYAFHALALDEYRTAFSPTMWELGDNNDNTTLRQVWFPGNHGDVGGGWEDEQAANIALAWLADQLTSIGVEFDRAEMQRVFYDVHGKVVPRNWAMGKIHNPPLSTAVLDKTWSAAQFKQPTPRSPGLYKRDTTKAKEGASWNLLNWSSKPPRENLGRTNEFVHPSVRIRYAKGGKGLDDEPSYPCRALIENKYQLVEIPSKQQPVPAPRAARAADASGPYETVGGGVAEFWDKHDLDGFSALANVPRVQVQQPVEDVDTLQVPSPHNTWAWKRPAVTDPKKPGVVLEKEIVLQEEQIGVWERLYMKVQEELVDWKPLYVARQSQAIAAEQAEKSAVTRAAGSAWGWVTGKKLEADDPGQRNYDDLIVWQRGLVK